MNYMRTAILLAGLTGLFMAVGYLIGGGSGALIALIIAAGTNLFSYWNADKLVLSMHGAQEVDDRSAPELVAIVRELAQRAGLPMPRVYLMDSPQPNAFATGRNPQNAAVCATTGLLNTLSRDEIAGVIGTNWAMSYYCGRRFNACAIRHVLPRRQSRQWRSRRRRLGIHAHSGAACGHDRTNGDQPHPGIRR